MKFAFIIDPIDRLNPVHDTSVALMEAAQELGHEVWITEINQLTIINCLLYTSDAADDL